MKNQIDMTPPTETNKAVVTDPVVTDPKEIEICELSDKKFRIILLKKFSENSN